MEVLTKAAGVLSLRRLFLLYGPLLVVTVCGLAVFGVFLRGDLVFLDRAFQWRGPQEPNPEIAIVAVSQQDFELGGPRWPWPRSLMARLIDEVSRHDPAVIAIDILYSEPSSSETLITTEAFGALRPFLYQSLSGREIRIQTREGVQVIGQGSPGFDAIVAGAGQARAQDIELAQAIERAMANGVDVVLAAQQIRTGQMTGVTGFYPELAAVAADSIGLVGVRTDSDGVLRGYLPYGIDKDGKTVYGMALAAAADYIGIPLPEYPSANGDVPIGDVVIRPNAGQFLVNYRGPAGTYPTLIARDLLRGEQDFSAALQGKIVFLGVTDPGAGDLYATPFSGAERMPGVEFQATAADTLLSNSFIGTAPRSVEVAAIVVLGLLGVVFGRFVHPLFGFLGASALAGLLLLAWIGLFIGASYLLPVTAPLVALSTAYVLGIANKVGVEQLEKQQARSLFSRYLSPLVVEEMLKTPRALALGGKRAELTVLFSDIRGFTTLSELLSPEEVVSLLNEYLTAMSEVIFQYEGTIDKFEGDAILAFFGAPKPHDDDPDRAVQTALAMRDRLDELQPAWQAKTHSPLQIGIGINTGPAVVGNVGSNSRMEYTIIGDAVNLASRLQEMTKEYHVSIIVSGDTHARLKGGYESVSLGRKEVRGRQHPVDLYEVVGLNAAVPPNPTPTAEAKKVVIRQSTPAGPRPSLPMRENGASNRQVPPLRPSG